MGKCWAFVISASLTSVSNGLAEPSGEMVPTEFDQLLFRRIERGELFPKGARGGAVTDVVFLQLLRRQDLGNHRLLLLLE